MAAACWLLSPDSRPRASDGPSSIGFSMVEHRRVLKNAKTRPAWADAPGPNRPYSIAKRSPIWWQNRTPGISNSILCVKFSKILGSDTFRAFLQQREAPKGPGLAKWVCPLAGPPLPHTQERRGLHEAPLRLKDPAGLSDLNAAMAVLPDACPTTPPTPATPAGGAPRGSGPLTMPTGRQEPMWSLWPFQRKKSG